MSRKNKFCLALLISIALLNEMVSGEEDADDGGGGSGADGEADDDGRVYKNPRNSPSAMCPRDEEQATLLGQKCLRKCSSDEDCKSKKKKCLCDGACGMSCIKPDRECPDLEQPKIGAVTVTGKLFGDKASYSCPHGYHVVGLQSRNCQADGEWAGQAPACKKNIYCLSPPTIEHARHSALPEQATFDLDATVTYSCLTGYVTNGFSRAKCLAIDGQASWYGPDISCEARSCGPPGDVPHGWVTAECHTFTCRALLQCGAGFELVGKADRYCQADGNWAPKELPTCVLVTAVQCAAPEGPRHGKAVYTSCAYNSVVSYECKYGYRLVGDATRRCGADKKWSGSQPACKEINCGHPGQLYNGWLENISAGTGLGASIIFRCHDGMKMEGNSSTICQIDGTWRYPLPKCLAPCVVPHVTQGKVVLVESNEVTSNDSSTSRPATQEVSSSTMVHHGEELIVECENNYEFPSNNPAVTCNNGTWTQIPRCQPARCKRMPKFPRNGMVLAAKTDHGMKARFRCKDGFELHGPQTVVCAFGNWTGLTPQCQEVYCPFPGFLENGKVLLVGNMGLYDYRPYVRKVVNNKQIMYDCDKGYVLSEGAPGATCIGGQWRPRELPKCTLGQHPRIRWSRRRRSIIDQLPPASNLHHITLPSHSHLHHITLPSHRTSSLSDNSLVQGLYQKYNPESRTPTLRHANYKILKRLDEDEEESEVDEFDEGAREHVPTALYTVYNIHGEPIGHRLLYTYQPVYQTDEDNAFEEAEEREPEITGDENLEQYAFTGQDPHQDNGPSMILLKGGMFADRSDALRSPQEHRSLNINSLKKRYFERYFDKRKKRFSNELNLNGETDKEIDDKGEGVENNYEYIPTGIVGNDRNVENETDQDFAESKKRTKREVSNSDARSAYHRQSRVAEFDRSVLQRQVRNVELVRHDSHEHIMHINLHRSVPNEEQLSQIKHSDVFQNFLLLAGKHVRKRDLEAEELTVIPLPKNRRVSSKTRDKRTSRKTDKLNQTTATVPKTGRDNKGGKSQLGLIPPLPDAPPSPSPDSSSPPDVFASLSPTSDAPRRPRPRPAVPCEPISSEPYVNIEVVRLGRDPNVSFSSGTIVRVACGKGYGLNLDTNATAKCVRGRWKPIKPLCQILPCHIPASEYGVYTLGALDGTLSDDTRELNETDDVGNGQVVQFSCQYGYNVQGPSNLRCWHGDWAVTSWPECVPMPCELPVLRAGAAYEAGYRAGLAVGHDASVAVHCAPQHAPPATLHCRLGRLQAAPQDYCAPVPGANVTIFKSKSEYQSGSDIVREDITELEPPAPGTTSTDCGPPTRVQGSLVYRSGWTENTTSNAGREVVGGYPHGTQVTFKCIASIMGEKTTWKIICEQGKWIGKSFNCEELEAAQSESLLNNSSCVFHNIDPNVVSFYQDMQVKEDKVEFSTGAVLVSRCVDIGKFAMTGSARRRCLGGKWDGEEPTCLGLNQENDYAMEKPPTILIRHEGGPIAQSNDGRLLVYPGTVLHMECLWMRRFGNPKWEVNHEYRKYPEGWSSDPGRDSSLEYRISIEHATKNDSGVFTCMTPARQTHQVEVVVEEVHCPVLAIRRGLIVSSQETKMSSEVSFSCANGNALLGAHTLVCLPSGNWSAPLPVCESVECGEVSISTSTSPAMRPRVSVVSRGVGGRAVFSCNRGWGLRGVTETVCLPNGQWAQPFPTCAEVWCPPPTAPANGYVLGNAPHRAGDVLQFHCNAEHALRGRPIVVCQDSGRWSDAPPSCEQACTYPGTTISGRMSSVKFYYRIGESITFSCEPGFRLKGAPMLRCLRNRKWSNAIPICTNSGSNSNDTTASSLAVLSARDELAMLSDESASLGRSRLAADRTLKAIVREQSMRARVVKANRLLYGGGDRHRDDIAR